VAIPTVQPCLSGESHAWGEWYFSEAQAGAVRRCVRCGVIMARGGAVVARATIAGHDRDVVRAQEDGIDLSGSPDGGSREAMFAWAQQVFEDERRKGRFDSAREQALSSLMKRLGDVIRRDGALDPDADPPAADPSMLKARLADRTKQKSDLLRLIDEIRPMVREKRTGSPLPEGTRPSRVAGLISEAQERLMGALTVAASGPESTRDALAQLWGRLTGFANRVRQPEGDEAWLVNLERDSLRSLMHEWREFDRRGHAMVARPIWSGPSLRVDVNRVLHAGPPTSRRVLERAADAIGMQVSALLQPGVDPAQACWKDAQRAGIAVFDLSERDPQVFYQLGQAYALGTDVLLLCREGVTIPFDVAQRIVAYRDGADLEEALPAALDTVLYGSQVSSAPDSAPATIETCRRIVAGAGGAPARGRIAIVLAQMQDAQDDPVAFRAALDQFLSQYGDSSLHLLQPRWPPRYPDPDRPCCFVVMPFDPRLTTTQEVYRELDARLSKTGLEVVRGDVAEGQDIIESIWEETAHADQVIVDLTGFNLNVCLELGMADTLGRPTVLIGERGTEQSLFPAIAKRRCHTYGSDYAETLDVLSAIERWSRRARAQWH
jgi:hypothetical protein